MINRLSSGKFKYVLFGIFGCLVIIIILFSLPIWTIPVMSIESYTETETKQEFYTEQEQYEISRTSRNELCYSINKTYGPGELAYIILYQDFRGIGIYDEPLQGFYPSSLPKPKYTISPRENGKVVFTWAPSGVSKQSVHAIVIDCAKLTLPPDIGSDNSAIMSYLLGNAIEKKYASSGMIEFNLLNIMSLHLCALINPKAEPGVTSTYINSNLKVSYKWDEIVTGTRTNTKYRDVPIQVEKQGTVTKYEKGSMWRLLTRR